MDCNAQCNEIHEEARTPAPTSYVVSNMQVYMFHTCIEYCLLLHYTSFHILSSNLFRCKLHLGGL